MSLLELLRAYATVSQDGQHVLKYTKGHVRRWTDLYAYHAPTGQGSSFRDHDLALLQGLHTGPSPLEAHHLRMASGHWRPGEDDAHHHPRDTLAAFEARVGKGVELKGTLPVSADLGHHLADPALTWTNAAAHVRKHGAETEQDAIALLQLLSHELGDEAQGGLAAVGHNLDATGGLAYLTAGRLHGVAAQLVRERREAVPVSLYRPDDGTQLTVSSIIPGHVLKRYGGSGQSLLGGHVVAPYSGDTPHLGSGLQVTTLFPVAAGQTLPNRAGRNAIRLHLTDS